MAKPGIGQIGTSQTFQLWLDKTNELIFLLENDVLTASALGDTTNGNAVLNGSFTANTIIASNTLRADTVSPRVGSTSVSFTAPVTITSSTQSTQTLSSLSGPRSLYSSGSVLWRTGFSNNVENAFIIDTGTGPTKFSLSTEGNLTTSGNITAVEFQGGGSNITSINANNVASGTLNVDRIPDLNANKITAGILNVDRIPDLNANKITAGVLNVARIPDLNANKITAGVLSDDRIPTSIVRNSRRLLSGTGISISGNGDLSDDRTIAVNIATLLQAQEGTSSSVLMTPQRTIDTINSNAIRGYIVFNGATGEVIKTRNLTLVKSGTGNYSITCAASIRDGLSNWGVVITNIDNGILTQTPINPNQSTINDFQASFFNAFVTTRTSTGFTVRAKTTFSRAFDFNVGNDRNMTVGFGITALDPAYIALIVF